MDLPSFLWLWKIAAWSMGFTILAYIMLATSGIWLLHSRIKEQLRPLWLPPLHYLTGAMMVLLVLLLLAIGLIGTAGHYGTLGHSPHLIAGLGVVMLVALSAWSASQISPQKPWARSLHLLTNVILLFGLVFVSLTGWIVVQKYLPGN
ncbi:MAG: DUF4079 domain-containing protein [Cyanobacteria bacterium J083]|nr:MAG: DUF4079 domain-containing protein [Cyanobacteria bacterium J083]